MSTTMKELYITVGLPRSGKSTYAKSTGWPIVSPDSIRLAIHGERFIAQAEPFVWVIAKAMVRALFLAGHDKVVLDSTSISPVRRDDWKSTDWKRRFIIFSADKDECIRRARVIEDEYIVPVIERMAADFVPLTPVELDELAGLAGTVEVCPYQYKDSEAGIVGFPTFGQRK